MLKAGGLDPDKDVKATTIGGLTDGFNKLQTNSIDATISALGIPLMEQANSTIPGGIVILDITGENANTEFINKELNGLYIDHHKKEELSRYSYIKDDMNITGFDIYLVGSAQLSEEDGYNIVKTLHDNWENLQQDNPDLRNVSQRELAAPSNTVPYHKGAIRFFKEKGYWTPENEEREKSF